VIVVSDTTPLNYLVLINAVDILHHLFNEVFVPTEVIRELQQPRTPEVVRRWTQTPPPWLIVKTPQSIDPSTFSLDRGEAEAISLAKELKAPIILMDERRATIVAQREKLTVVRTLALLELAGEQKLLDLPSTLRSLQATNFRISQSHIDAALRRTALRKGPGNQPPSQID
jgi:predicted nucleic acid-binding protein